MNILKEIDLMITTFLENIGILAPIIASILMVIESIIPILPLALFITINFYYLGPLHGFIYSWILTCLGCFISFMIFRNKVKFWFDNKYIKKNEGKLIKWMLVVNNLKFEQLVLLIAIPFTPAFLINIVAGVSSMSKKKFVVAILIGKIFLVYFWGFVGTSMIESFKNPTKLLQIIVLSLAAFIISKLINKKFGIE